MKAEKEREKKTTKLRQKSFYEDKTQTAHQNLIAHIHTHIQTEEQLYPLFEKKNSVALLLISVGTHT